MTEEERLRAENLALHAKIHQLERAVASCLHQGAKLRHALSYYREDQGAAGDRTREALEDA